ncbi:redoxin domain-containing protein [Winogradskyella sp.]|uniref:redoxin domain-containing protein n=1 Tax=Winogradskyella sp. TaxID=1883156 RepID=UPI003F6D100C
MKRLLTLTTIGLLLFSCKQENRTDYVINGSAKGVYNGIRVYMKSLDERGREIVNDTAIVFDEKFTMTGKVDYPQVRYLSVNNVEGDLLFMLENSEIDIEVNKDLMLESKVEGSKTHSDLVAYQNGMKVFQDESRELVAAYRQLNMAEDIAQKDSLKNLLEISGQKYLAYPTKFIKEHNDSYFSLNLIGLETNKPKIDIKAFIEAYDNLTPRLKESAKGKEVKKKLDSLLTEYEKTAYLEIGKVAPNFEAPKPDGTIVSLEELKGKVTIVDFWAAWCGPCRRENPNVVRIYNQYHNDGLEIVGVSLDGTSRQQDPKKAWLDAIEKDNLTWNHVSHLQYFNDPVARLYNITSIPATYILDEEGKIAAKNLRGRALELKVKELLEK